MPRRIVYDNLKPAVRRLRFPHRQLTERFAALVSHYLYEPCFARPGEGHDKGGVEGRGRGVRLQHLTPIPRGDSLAELPDWLQGEVDRHAAPRVWERFAEERPLVAEYVSEGRTCGNGRTGSSGPQPPSGLIVRLGTRG